MNSYITIRSDRSLVVVLTRAFTTRPTREIVIGSLRPAVYSLSYVLARYYFASRHKIPKIYSRYNANRFALRGVYKCSNQIVFQRPVAYTDARYITYFLRSFQVYTRQQGCSGTYTWVYGVWLFICCLVNAITLEISYDTRVYAFLKIFYTNVQNVFLCHTNFNKNICLVYLT